LSRCNNEGDSDDGHDDNNDCNCADAILNDAFDYMNLMNGNDNVELHATHDIIINNGNDMDHTFEYNADEDELEDVYDDNLTGMTDNIADNIAATVADRYDMIVLDMQSNVEENSDDANDSEIDENDSIEEEPEETNDINEISTNLLLKYKQSATNAKPSLQSNMIAAIELLSLL